MFCPGCGSEESQVKQYCRACGANLSAVRTVLDKPDELTASAISARDEIGRAVAAKIKETQSVSELRQVTWELLPVVAEFLESPEEKRAKREEQRLERLRAGVITALVGVGVTILAMFISMSISERFMPFIGIGMLTFLIGLSILINGLWFTISKKSAREHSLETGKQDVLNRLSNPSPVSTSELPSTAQQSFLPSITEHTTHQLADKPPLARPLRLNRD